MRSRIPATLTKAVVSVAFLAVAVVCWRSLVTGADHTDGPLTMGDQSADIADVYSFRDGNDLVLAMTLSNVQAAPQIQLGQSIFDPEVLYQFKIDDDGDAVEDLVIQAVVTGPPNDQEIHVVGPVAPTATGTMGKLVSGGPVTTVDVSTGATANIGTGNGLTVFAGVRDDPFFFDLTRFREILAGQATSFADPGTNTFAGLNVYAIVVELPLSMLGDPADLSVWGTTSR
jgi:hypothetical protein